MNKRHELQAILENLLGSKNVYFQPPENFKMGYPCIVYARDTTKDLKANNKLYNSRMKYKVIYMDKNPDSIFHDKIKQLPMCALDRFYSNNNLNHTVLTLYF